MMRFTSLLSIAALLVIALSTARTLSSSLTVVGYDSDNQELQEAFDRQIQQLGQDHSAQQNALQSKITDLTKEIENLKQFDGEMRQLRKEHSEQQSTLQGSITGLMKEIENLKQQASAASSRIGDEVSRRQDSQQQQQHHPCTNSDFVPPKNSIAMATFVTDMGGKRSKPRADYTYGAGALIKSIQKHVGNDKVDKILLEIPTRRLPDRDREYLRELGWNICTVTPIEALHKPFGRFIDQFNKFHLWNFMSYEKILYLDADALVVGNIDPLLERNLAPGKRIGVTQDYFGIKFVDKFNMGVFMIHPNRTEFDRLVELQANDAVKYDTGQAEQGFLNALYKTEWEEIGIEYNANMAVWAQKREAWPANPSILHFTLEKPWQDEPPQHRVRSSEPLDNFLNIWIDAAREYGVLWDVTEKATAKEIAPMPTKKLKQQNAKGVILGSKASTTKQHSCSNADFSNTHDKAVFTLLIPKQETYVTAARVLGTSIAAHTTDTDLVILELSTNLIPDSTWAQLQSSGWTHKCTIEPVKAKKRPSPRFVDQFSKLRVWGITVYKTAVYLDADTFVMGNIDDILNIDLGSDKIGVTADFRMDYGKYGEWATTFNMGAFVIHPDQVEYKRLLKLQGDGAITEYEFIMAEQGWLNAVYKESWKDIGMIYNANVAARADEKFKEHLNDIRIVHYTTMKPWHASTKDPHYKSLCEGWVKTKDSLS